MEQKPETQSAFITDHGDQGPFSWPPAIWVGLALCAIVSLFAWSNWTFDSEDSYARSARAAIWTTYAVGNPHTLALGNVRPSLVDSEIVCGRINYEKVSNGGWSGFTDFYLEHGVFYIAPPGGRFEKRFTMFCLGSDVDRP